MRVPPRCLGVLNLRSNLETILHSPKGPLLIYFELHGTNIVAKENAIPLRPEDVMQIKDILKNKLRAKLLHHGRQSTPVARRGLSDRDSHHS